MSLLLLQVRDRLMYGSLHVSPTFLKMESPKRAACMNFKSIQDFKNGELDAKNLQDLFPNGVQCLRIAIGPKQKSWVAITEVAVFTEDEVAVEIPQVNATLASTQLGHNKTLKIRL